MIFNKFRMQLSMLMVYALIFCALPLNGYAEELIEEEITAYDTEVIINDSRCISNSSIILTYAKQIREENSGKSNYYSGDFSWDTEKKTRSWTYYNGLILDSFMMMGDNDNYTYVDRFYSDNIDSDGTIVNMASSSSLYAQLDSVEPTRPVFDLLETSKNKERYQKAISYIYDMLTKQKSYADCGGNFLHKNNWTTYQIALDGLYMAQPFMMECGNAIDEGNLTISGVNSSDIYNDVYTRMLWIYDNMYDSKTGLYNHAYNVNSSTDNGICWFRAEGWYAMALVDIIEMMPDNTEFHEKREMLKSHLPRIFDGAMQYQNSATGMWKNIPADNSCAANKDETSGTAMFAYAMMKAYNKGFVSDNKYAVAGLNAFNGIVDNKVSSNGDRYVIKDIYKSSGAETVVDSYCKSDYYVDDEAKGTGPLIMAAVQVKDCVELLSKSSGNNSSTTNDTPGKTNNSTTGNNSSITDNSTPGNNIITEITHKAIEAGTTQTMLTSDVADIETFIENGPANTWRKLTDYFALYCNKNTRYTATTPRIIRINDVDYLLTHRIVTGGDFGGDKNNTIDVEGNPIGNYTGDLGRKAVWFTTENAGKVTVYWATNTTQTENGDNIALYEIDNNTAKLVEIDLRTQDELISYDETNNTQVNKLLVKSTFDIPEAGTYFIGSDAVYLVEGDTSTKAAGSKSIYAMIVEVNKVGDDNSTTDNNTTSSDGNTTSATDNSTTSVDENTTTTVDNNTISVDENNSTIANNTANTTTGVSNLTDSLVTNQTEKVINSATAEEIDVVIEVALDNPTYDGSKKIPELEIVIDNQTLAEGSDYKVTCKNNKNADTEYNEEKGVFEYSSRISEKKRATYIISFKGQYKKLSKVSGTYMIYPAPMTFVQITPKKDVIVKKPGRKFKAIKSIVNGLTHKKLSLTKDIDVLNIQLIPCNEKGVPTGDKAINLNESAMADSGNYLIRVYGKGNYYSYTTDGMFRLDVK